MLFLLGDLRSSYRSVEYSSIAQYSKLLDNVLISEISSSPEWTCTYPSPRRHILDGFSYVIQKSPGLDTTVFLSASMYLRRPGHTRLAAQGQVTSSPSEHPYRKVRDAEPCSTFPDRIDQSFSGLFGSIARGRLTGLSSLIRTDLLLAT